MPPLELGHYLIDRLFDVGPVVHTGMGATQLRSEHLIAWQQETGIRLQSWEARFLRRLSIDYLSEAHRAEKRDAKAPWQPDDYKPDLAAVAKSMRQQIAELANL